jgi:hypothetical protein
VYPAMAVLPGESRFAWLIGCAVMKADRSSGGGATPPPGDAWNALSYLLSGFLLFGGIGVGLDALFGTRWGTPVGLLAGGTASAYLIYVRYVKS